MEFKIIIKVTSSSQVCMNQEINSYYTEKNYDNILISNDEIQISGNRGNEKNLKKILCNFNSTLYKQIIKCLSYYYLYSRSSMRIEEILLIRDKGRHSEKIDKFNQPFEKHNSMEYTPNLKVLKNLFIYDEANSDLYLNAITYYIKAIQEENFEHYWKSFNSLYSICSKAKTEQEKLRNMRMFVEKNRDKFVRTVGLISKDNFTDIRKLRIREFILDTYPSASNTKSFAEMIRRFTDVRIMKLFSDTLPYRKEYLTQKNLIEEVEDHITETIKRNENDDIQLLNFYLLKYANFIRNKYFHAEKAYATFLLDISSEAKELKKINSILKVFIMELMENIEIN